MSHTPVTCLASAVLVATVTFSTTNAQEHKVLRGSFGHVLASGCTPDGKMMVSAHGDGELPGIVKVWDLTSLKQRSVVEGTGDLSLLALSPDGKLLAGGKEKNVVLWDIGTGKEVASLEGHTQKVTLLEFQPGKALLASASKKGEVKLWDTRRRRLLRSIKAHRGEVTAMAFLQGGSALATAGKDRSVTVWDVRTAQPKVKFVGHTDPITALTVSEDDKLLASASQDLEIRVWSVSNGEEQSVFKGHKETVRSLAFSPDGHRLLSVDKSNSARIWDVEMAKQLHAFESKKPTSFAGAFSPDSKYFAITQGKRVGLYDLGTLRPIRVLGGNKKPLIRLHFTPDSSMLVGSGLDRDVHVWKLAKD